MNWATEQYFRASARYYMNRQPADLAALRPIWARARALALAPGITPELTPAELAIVDPPPGEAALLSHRGGLHITIEGDLLHSFPVAEYVSAIRKAVGTITL